MALFQRLNLEGFENLQGLCRVTVFIILAIFAFTSLSSGADLAVEIKTTPDQDVLPLEVEFEAVVTGGTSPYSYTWNFGDGGSSTFQKDSHYYRETGQYKVSLMVTDAADNYGMASKTITVSVTVFDPKNTVFTNYSNTNYITAITQDKNESNELWLGTDGGLVRFNTLTGKKKYYLNELPGISVNEIIKASDGALWIGTYDGLARFEYETDQWIVYTASDSGLPDNRVSSLVETFGGAVWVGTYDGLSRFDYKTGHWTVYNLSDSGLPSNSVYSLIETSDGTLWVGTYDSLVRFEYKTDQWTVYTSSDSKLPSGSVTSLLETSDGALWVGTYDGLARFDYKTNEWTVYTDSDNRLGRINCFLETSDGAVWAGTRFSGLARFEDKTGQWTIYTDSDSGLPNNNVWDILEISDGALWIGTYNGLTYFNYKTNQWTVYTPSDSGLPDNYILSVIETSDGDVWVGTGDSDDGPTRFDYKTGQWMVYTASDSGLLSSDTRSLLEASDGAVWMGKGGDLARFDYKTNHWSVYTRHDSGLPSWVENLLETSDGAIWIGTYGGLARFDYKINQWSVYTESDSGLPDNSHLTLLETSDGALWVGTAGKGLARFEYKTNEWIVYSSSDSGLPLNAVFSLLETSDGAVWVGTAGKGLARFEYKTNEWTVYTIYNSGMPSNAVFCLLEASDGAIWAGAGSYSTGGLARFDYKTNKWTVYTSSDSGLPDNYITSIFESSDGAIWVGTHNGLSRISFPSPSKSPGILILIAGGGAAKTNTIWHTTKELATSAYRTFNIRGFRNTDIYLMSPEKWFDFNGDGFDDHVVDCPPANEDRNLTVEDVRYAITGWAVKTHASDTPLVIYLIDHGYPEDDTHSPYFMIAPGELLYASDLNDMLNTYETATGGQVILINESCYSGQFLNYLKKQGRIIITATADKVVNYDNWGANSFTSHFLQKIFENNSIFQAFAKTKSRLGNSPFTSEQTPQLDDNGDGKHDTNDGIIASSLKIGGDHSMGAPWPEITDVTKTAPAGSSASFTLRTNAHMKKVWGTVQTPGYIPDMSGDFQQIDLEKFDLWDNDGNLVYEGAYDKFTQKGKYIITFYAKDQFGNVALSDPVEIHISVTPGDINSDSAVNLADAVLALKIIAGTGNSNQSIDLGTDIDHNGRIGLEDAVFVLQKTASIR